MGAVIEKYGVIDAINYLYGNDTDLKPKDRLALTEHWKPYKSYASLYLWRSLDNR
jgi:3-methyladenine DNA glycosylase/8-oxoguanine DNA glycosylase